MTTIKNTIFILFMIVSMTAHAQSKKKQDVKSILDMCGCYEITFNFAETFAPDPSYTFHDNYKSGALEYVFPVSQEKNKIVLQHLLVIGDSMIIKHWRQDWLYENRDLYTYHKNHTWKHKSLTAHETKGQWTQKVYQVDDSPRYEGSGSWVHVDGKHYWESQADAPLPRREYSKRHDYNVTVRRNRHEITDYGWVHDQNNDKVIRTTAGDQLLASEKGMNTYKKVDDKPCQVAQQWWNNHHTYWADVRETWDEVFASKKDVSLYMKVDQKALYERLFALGDEAKSENYSTEVTKEKVMKIIQKHSKESDGLTSIDY